MKITVLGVVVIVAVAVILFALYQRGNQNRNPGLDQDQGYADWQ